MIRKIISRKAWEGKVHGEKCPHYYMPDSMKEYCGKSFEVKKILNNTKGKLYKFIGTQNWQFCECLLEHNTLKEIYE